MSTLSRLPDLPSDSRVFLGLDLSKTGWHLTVRSQGETLLAQARPAKVDSLLPLLEAMDHCQVFSVYEAGPFGYGLHDWLVSQGVRSIVCSPAQVPVEVGNRVKTDRRDSLKLATMLEAGLLRAISVPSPQQRADRELVRQRERLQRRRRSAMHQIKSFLLTYGIVPPTSSAAPWRRSFVDWLANTTLQDPVLHASFDSLRRSFFEADQQLREHTQLLKTLASTKRHTALVTLLSSAPGVGWLTALTFSVEIFDWSRFKSGEALSSFLGLTPSQYSSGESIHYGSITRTGNWRLRSLLVESCWAALRADPALRKSYENIKRRRGGKRAAVAIARKMCHRLVAMVRTGELYRAEPE